MPRNPAVLAETLWPSAAVVKNPASLAGTGQSDSSQYRLCFFWGGRKWLRQKFHQTPRLKSPILPLKFLYAAVTPLPNLPRQATLLIMKSSRRKHYIPQFDIHRALRHRPLERLFFHHEIFGPWVKRFGRLSITAMLWPRLVAPYRWSLVHSDMPISGLPQTFHGYKILHLTDFHAGATRQSYLRRVLATAMQAKPDLILISGDLIDYVPAGLPALRELLPLLCAPDGIFACFGNHDYHEYSWRHVGKRSGHRAIHKRLRLLLAKANVPVLCNQSAAISRGTARLWIVGIDELWTGNADPAAAFAGVAAGEPCICLEHNPDGCVQLQNYPWHWMLCGHSHGGQVVFPMVGPLFVPMEHREWIDGIYHFSHPVAGHQRMYVSRGIGSTIPLRMRCPPESRLFTLRPESPIQPT